MHAQPKPIKRATRKARMVKAKNLNIADVRSDVEERDGERCRISALLAKFGFYVSGLCEGRLELAHVAGRGMGGNPDLSRDTTANTLLVRVGLHQGVRGMHSGHLKVRALTGAGADGPCCFEFYEVLPTEL